MSIVSEFKTFMMRGNVVDLAVGVVIGGAFGKIVSALVDNIIMPPIGYITGGIDFSHLSLKLPPMDPTKPVVEISYGIFINTIIQFLIIGVAIFLVVKAINKLMPPPPAADPSPPGPSQEELLARISGGTESPERRQIRGFPPTRGMQEGGSMSTDRFRPWFAPKRYGYGSGLPIAWQGWVVLAAYLLICGGGSLALPLIFPNPAVLLPAILVVVLVATVALLFICKAKTKGGWRWRWGEDEP